jgi:hypothetical protein
VNYAGIISLKTIALTHKMDLDYDYLPYTSPSAVFEGFSWARVDAAFNLCYKCDL